MFWRLVIAYKRPLAVYCILCVCICEVVEIFSLLFSGLTVFSLHRFCLPRLLVSVSFRPQSTHPVRALCPSGVLLRLALKTFWCVDFECVGQFWSSTQQLSGSLTFIGVFQGRIIIFKFIAPFYLFLHSSMSYFHVIFCAVSYLAPQEPK